MISVPSPCFKVWGIAGTLPLQSSWRLLGVAGSIIISVALALAVTKARGATDGTFNGGIYGIAVVAEVVAIGIAAVVLNRRGQSSFVPAMVAAIVGLHFIGLWLATGNFTLVWVAVALCAVGVISASVTKDARMPVAGIGSALALLAHMGLCALRMERS